MTVHDLGDGSLIEGDVLDGLRSLPDESVQCVVTSPPYWNMRDYCVAGQIGLEPTVEEWVARMVEVFREVRRVLRKDGTCWINLGDSYAANRSYQVQDSKRTDVGNNAGSRVPKGLKTKDLIGQPWRVAFALQADGWWLRSDIVWAKPNPMPESVTDRPTKAHEYLFLLAKSDTYFYDAEAVREMSITGDSRRPYTSEGAWELDGRPKDQRHGGEARDTDASGRNLRSVWTIATQPYSGAHFATFPEEIPKRCILAGTSAKGACPECGAPWERISEKEATGRVRERSGGGLGTERRRAPLGLPPVNGKFQEGIVYRTVGWQPTCECHTRPSEAVTVPCTVLDPFVGSGTALAVARSLGRRFVGIELNPSYCALALHRIGSKTPALAGLA